MLLLLAGYLHTQYIHVGYSLFWKHTASAQMALNLVVLSAEPLGQHYPACYLWFSWKPAGHYSHTPLQGSAVLPDGKFTLKLFVSQGHFIHFSRAYPLYVFKLPSLCLSLSLLGGGRHLNCRCSWNIFLPSSFQRWKGFWSTGAFIIFEIVHNSSFDFLNFSLFSTEERTSGMFFLACWRLLVVVPSHTECSISWDFLLSSSQSP